MFKPLIKRFREKALDEKYSRDPNAYKKIIATQRTKEFTRESVTDDTKTPKEQYLMDAKSVLDNGVFAEIDMKCLLQKFETHQYEIEEAWRNRKDDEATAAAEKRRWLHAIGACMRKCAASFVHAHTDRARMACSHSALPTPHVDKQSEIRCKPVARTASRRKARRRLVGLALLACTVTP